MNGRPEVVRILLADDHPVLRRGLRALLDGEADLAVVGEAGDGQEAVHLAERLTPDVIVMDISMPKMDGLEATRQIKARCLSCHVLILTVHAQERYLFPVLKAGAVGYVRKSAADQELVEAIRVAAQGGVFLYPNAVRMLLEDYLDAVRAGEERDAYDRLSEREREVLKALALGHTAGEIAETLALSPKSVDTYRARIMQKLGLQGRAELVRYALARGLLTEEM